MPNELALTLTSARGVQWRAQSDKQRRDRHRHELILKKYAKDEQDGWMAGWMDGWMVCQAVKVMLLLKGNLH